MTAVPGAAPEPRVLGGRYELGEVVGRGGMAVVHAAQDRVLHRRVAVKLLHPDLARDPEFQTRFRREARSAAALNHPDVVGVHDVGEETGPSGEQVLYIVMELVRGVTARDLLLERRRPQRPAPGTTGTTDLATQAMTLPAVEEEPPTPPEGVDAARRAGAVGLDVEQAVGVTAGVLSALAYSHRQGIVHRDIKPANVMLTQDGRVKVMDFGIARAMADVSATATQTAAVMGTAQYLSPEQARGRPVDARTDLYSTGCLLYELLTGRPPFQGESAVSLAYQHVSEEPEPPSTHRPDLPRGLDAVVLRALAKEPADRYPDAEAFREDLLAASKGVDVAATTAVATAATTAVPAPPPVVPVVGPADEAEEPPRRGRRVAVVLGVLAALALVAAAAVLLPGLLADDEPTAPPPVVVQDVVGRTAEAAEAALRAQGLEVTRSEAPSQDVPEGDVTATVPPAGREVERGSSVDLVVSTGPSSVEVPAVVGEDEDDARALLEEAGLGVGDVETGPDVDAPEGEVVGSDPAPGTAVTPGGDVDLQVSDGTVVLDDYRGLTVRAAREAVSQLGLTPQVRYEESTAEENSVVRQDPGPGAVPQGSDVLLYVATPPPPTPTAAPTTSPPTAPPTPTEAPTTPPTGTVPPTTEPPPTTTGAPTTDPQGR